MPVWSRAATRLRRSLEAVGVRFEISGVENADWSGGPFVFAANHMSALETQILPSILGPAAPCTFVVKSSLLGYPVFGPVLKAFDPIVVERADPKAGSSSGAGRGGASAWPLECPSLSFPRLGARWRSTARGSTPSGVRLARAAGVPIVPIALQTSAWSEGRLLQDIGWIEPKRPVRFAIGEADCHRRGQPRCSGTGGVLHRRQTWRVGRGRAGLIRRDGNPVASHVLVGALRE